MNKTAEEVAAEELNTRLLMRAGNPYELILNAIRAARIEGAAQRDTPIELRLKQRIAELEAENARLKQGRKTQ